MVLRCRKPSSEESTSPEMEHCPIHSPRQHHDGRDLVLDLVSLSLLRNMLVGTTQPSSRRKPPALVSQSLRRAGHLGNVPYLCGRFDEQPPLPGVERWQIAVFKKRERLQNDDRVEL